MNYKLRLAAGAALLALIFVGCDSKQQDQAVSMGQSALHSAADFASKTWANASKQASGISLDSAKSTIESAKSSLEAAKNKLSGIKMPSSLDALRLDNIKEQLLRVEAALQVKNLQAEMKQRVDDASRLKHNAQKSYEDVKAKLEQADKDYQDLKKRLDTAQSEYDAASQKVKETTQKLESLQP